MTPSARLASALEILELLETQRRPLAEVLKDWGITHRFAGSKDRSALGNLCYDVLRRKLSSQNFIGEQTMRAALLGMLKLGRGYSVEDISILLTGEKYALPALTANEKKALAHEYIPGKTHIDADCPEWLFPSFQKAFGNSVIAELQALRERAPLDIRINTLKTSRDEVKAKLGIFSPSEGNYSPHALRFMPDAEGRTPSLTQEIAFVEGLYEVMDEGSQLVSALAGAKAGETIIDLCAGGGGKALALAAQMTNQGRILATDIDRRRLTPLAERKARAGASIIEIYPPENRTHEPISELGDRVLIDAPCTGTGTWRRNPDAKWRMREGALNERQRDQQQVLSRGARLLKPSGTLIYITCSLLPQENDGAIETFLASHQGFHAKTLTPDFPCHKTKYGVQLTPHLTQTDGFYVSVLERG